MGQFRKKPVVIEAVQVTSITITPIGKWDAEFGEALPDWMREAIDKGNEKAEGGIWPDVERVYRGDGQARLMIGTLESPHEASPGDWIARGIKGELYPIKPEIFAELYDPA